MASGLLLLVGVVYASRSAPFHPASEDRPGRVAACFAAAALFAWLPGAVRLRRAARQALYGTPARGFRLVLFFLGLCVYGWMGHTVFGGVPRLDDGVAAVFQARIFARGDLTLPLPAHPEFYEIFGVLGRRAGLGHWCGMYPPCWPALLVPGVLLGATWLVNAVAGAALLVTVCALGREFFGEAAGRTAAVLGLLSPFVAVCAGLHLSHLPTALFCGLCLLWMKRLFRTRKWGYGWLTGLAWGAAFLCRPLTALTVGAVFAAGFLFPLRGVWTNRRALVAAALVAASAVGTLLAYQRATTGGALTPGHRIGMGRRGKFGFVRLDHVRTHTPALGAEHTLRRVAALNDRLLEWPFPDLAVVLLPFLLGRARRDEWILFAPLPVLLAAFACYWYYESFFPGRYLCAAVPFLLVLAGRGLDCVREAVRERSAFVRGLPLCAVTGSVLFALTTGVPAHFERYDSHFGDVESVLGRVVRDYGITNAVVFMDAVGIEEHEDDRDNDYYATGFLRNDLDLEGDVIYVRNRREQDVRIMKAYPDRAYYLYRYVRDRDRARLYRLIPAGDSFDAVPVAPRTSDLVLPP